MSNKNSQSYDPRPVFDVKLVPLKDHFESIKAMRWAYFKAAFPDLLIAVVYLYAIINFLNISPEFRSNMEGLIILELIILILFPLMFRIFAAEKKNEFRASSKIKFMTGWINSFNILFLLAIMLELAFFTSRAEGRKWIPLELGFLTAFKIYTVFFSGEKKVKPKFFVYRMTSRLVGGSFFGLFAYFFMLIPVGLLLNPGMLSEICMLLVGYVFFVMMGVFTFYKQDFLPMLDPPSSFKNFDQDEEMICEIWYPRLELSLGEFKKMVNPNLGKINKYFRRKNKKSWGFWVLLFALLLPGICILPMRSKFLAYSEKYNMEIQKNKIAWEERFNLGFAFVFGTCMLWILTVIPMISAREHAVIANYKQSEK